MEEVRRKSQEDKERPWLRRFVGNLEVIKIEIKIIRIVLTVWHYMTIKVVLTLDDRVINVW